MPKKLGGWVVVVALVLVAGLVCLSFFKRQMIIDYVKLADYRAPASISQLASEDTMTTSARRFFYLNHPVLEGKASFRQDCPSGTEQTVVLGCYHSGENGVFLLSVSDPRLAGVEQVTAAHEMLHAAYEQLPASERSQVDNWLLAYYKTIKNPELLATFASYRKTEPGQVVNEMHSIFGTEIANLPPNLENYYRRYFTDRSKITDYYNNYNAAFTNLKQQITDDDSQLGQMKAQITSDEADLKQRNASLSLERSQLNQEAASGDISGFNSGVGSFNSSVDSYNALVQQVQTEIANYNQLVQARNQLAISVNGLAEELNARIQTITPAGR